VSGQIAVGLVTESGLKSYNKFGQLLVVNAGSLQRGPLFIDPSEGLTGLTAILCLIIEGLFVII